MASLASPPSSQLQKLCQHAQALLDSGDPESAVLFLRRAAGEVGVTPDVHDALADVEVSLGNTVEACKSWMRSIELSGDPHDHSQAERWLYIAQIQEGDESRRSYMQGIALLQARSDVARAADGDVAAAVGEQEGSSVRSKLCTAFCALADLYLTDLCFEEGAEAACQAALDQAAHYNHLDSYEPMQGLASLRLSQGNHAEATQLMLAAFERISASATPVEGEARLAASKLLMECAPHKPECADAALDLLANLMREDDENVEIWFMMGKRDSQLCPARVAVFYAELVIWGLSFLYFCWLPLHVFLLLRYRKQGWASFSSLPQILPFPSNI